MKIGYARVSSAEQNLDLQIDALKKAGCKKIFSDELSGVTAKRKGLSKAKEHLRSGDTLVVWRLDRLGRSLKDLIQWITDLNHQKIDFISLHENIDTSTATGKFTFHLFGALSEFERNLIRERTTAGLAAARARGKKGGRPHTLSEEEKVRAVQLYYQRKLSISEICKMFGITKPTLYAYVKDN